jgi:isoleucyl-tRNA synthetase
MLMSVHGAIKSALEVARGDKVVGSSLQSSVMVSTSDANVTAVFERYADELDGMFVVSSLDVNAPLPESPEWSYTQNFDLGTVTVLPPRDAKCPRCWRYVAPVKDALCGRCEDIVKEGEAA